PRDRFRVRRRSQLLPQRHHDRRRTVRRHGPAALHGHGGRLMGSRGARARALAGAVVVAALLTGCAGEVVAGQGVPDWSYADERARDLLRVQVVAAGAALETSSPFTSTAQPDVTGVGYVHAAYGDRDTGS